jgi:hypothetical protein
LVYAIGKAWQAGRRQPLSVVNKLSVVTLLTAPLLLLLSLAYAEEGVGVCGVLWAGKAQAMQRALVLVFPVLLLSCSFVWAECSWVLWEKISFTETGEQAKKSKKPPKEIPRGKWEVKSAFPPVTSEHGSLTSFAFCVRVLKNTLIESQNEWKGIFGENQVSQLLRRLKNSVPYAVGPSERGRARSTNMRHHNSSNLNLAFFARRNGYEPTHPIPFPRATRGL